MISTSVPTNIFSTHLSIRKFALTKKNIAGQQTDRGHLFPPSLSLSAPASSFIEPASHNKYLLLTVYTVYNENNFLRLVTIATSSTWCSIDTDSNTAHPVYPQTI